jgi:hypothetical protein
MNKISRSSNKNLISVELHITNSEEEDLLESDDLRKKLQSKQKKRKLTLDMAEQKQAVQDKAAYDKLAKEMSDLREELLTLRQEVVKSGATNTSESALGFNKEEFLAMSPTKSLQWVTTTLAPRLKLESIRYQSYFGAIRLLAMSGEMVVWTCAGYNRGTQCHAKWHVYERSPRTSRDIRLHCCTLCYDGLGILSEHRLIDCPWLKESTWIEIRGGPSSRRGSQDELHAVDEEEKTVNDAMKKE